MFMAQRPTFLSIICILLALFGIVMLLLGVMMLALSGDSIWDEIGVDFGSALMLGMGAGFLLVGLLTMLAVYLLWNGKKIGWYITIILLVINAIMGILAFPAGLLNLLITVVLIWYFFRPNVKEFFGV